MGLVCASLLVDNPVASVAIRFRNDLTHFSEARPTANHVRQEMTIFICEPSHGRHAIFSTRFELRREEAQPRPEPERRAPRRR